MTQPSKAIIGLTGGIASGKSTVARILEEFGIPIVDADVLAREVVARGSDGLREVVDAFGPEVLTPERELDRAKVAARVFNDDAARKRLNGIIHPRVYQLSIERLAAAAATSAPYAVYEAPLLVETGAHRGLAALIVVAASEPVQVERSIARDGLSEAEARARIAAQLPLSAKVKEADYVIDNDADIATLRERTERTHQALVRRFASSEA